MVDGDWWMVDGDWWMEASKKIRPLLSWEQPRSHEKVLG